VDGTSGTATAIAAGVSHTVAIQVPSIRRLGQGILAVLLLGMGAEPMLSRGRGRLPREKSAES
jgi:hypothetical protein